MRETVWLFTQGESLRGDKPPSSVEVLWSLLHALDLPARILSTGTERLYYWYSCSVAGEKVLRLSVRFSVQKTEFGIFHAGTELGRRSWSILSISCFRTPRTCKGKHWWDISLVNSPAWHITQIRLIGTSGIWKADGFTKFLTRFSSLAFFSAVHIITWCHTGIQLQSIWMSVCRPFSRLTLFSAPFLFRISPSVQPLTKSIKCSCRAVHVHYWWSRVTKLLEQHFAHQR